MKGTDVSDPNRAHPFHSFFISHHLFGNMTVTGTKTSGSSLRGHLGNLPYHLTIGVALPHTPEQSGKETGVKGDDQSEEVFCG